MIMHHKMRFFEGIRDGWIRQSTRTDKQMAKYRLGKGIPFTVEVGRYDIPALQVNAVVTDLVEIKVTRDGIFLKGREWLPIDKEAKARNDGFPRGFAEMLDSSRTKRWTAAR